MNEDQAIGAAKTFGGKVQQGLGAAMGDTKMRAQGAVNEAEGAIQGTYGQVKDAASDAAEYAMHTALTIEDTVRDTIENRPYTAAAIALAIGFFVGRFLRR